MRASPEERAAAVLELRRRHRAVAEAVDWARYRNDPVGFNLEILGRDSEDGYGNQGYWRAQREIVESVRDHMVTLVYTGNMIGKSHAAAGTLLWFLKTVPNCLVLATARKLLH